MPTRTEGERRHARARPWALAGLWLSRTYREGAVLTVRDEVNCAQPSPRPGGEFRLAVVGPTGRNKGDDLLDAVPRPQLLHLRPVGLKIRPSFPDCAPFREVQVCRAWVLRQSTGELVDAAKAQMSHLVGRGIQFLARRPVDRQEDPLLSYVVTREDVEGPAPAGVPLPVFDRLDNVIDRRRLVWELVLWLRARRECQQSADCGRQECASRGWARLTLQYVVSRNRILVFSFLKHRSASFSIMDLFHRMSPLWMYRRVSPLSTTSNRNCTAPGQWFAQIALTLTPSMVTGSSSSGSMCRSNSRLTPSLRATSCPVIVEQ